MADNTKKSTRTFTSVLKFIWGAVPVIVLVLIIMILSGAIESKSDKLEAIKTGGRGIKSKTNGNGSYG